MFNWLCFLEFIPCVCVLVTIQYTSYGFRRIYFVSINSLFILDNWFNCVTDICFNVNNLITTQWNFSIYRICATDEWMRVEINQNIYHIRFVFTRFLNEKFKKLIFMSDFRHCIHFLKILFAYFNYF